MRILTPAWCRRLTVGLLLLQFTQLVTSAVVKSPTFDEPFHASRGYVNLAVRDWQMMQAGHTPFIYLLTGPLFWSLPDRPDLHELLARSAASSHREMAWEVLRAFDRPLDVLIFPPRVIVMGLTLLLGAALCRWAAERHGSAAGVLTLFVYTFSPNILAHGRLITTDLAFTCCFFLAVYTFQCLLVQSSVRRLMATGLALGFALGSKVSGLLLIPVFALLTLLRTSGIGVDILQRLRSFGEWSRRLASFVGWLVLTVLIAFFVLWALYGFETGSWAEHWLALPTYVKAVLQVRNHSERGHPAFLMGQRSAGGWWQYFPIALLLKTPLPTLIGAFAGTVWLVRWRRWWAVLTGVLPPALFFIVALRSSLNIGYRHILPVVPFLILLVGALAEAPWRCMAGAMLGGGMALWLVVGTFGIYPDYLAYFNELAGGPAGGHRYLTDSNLDWGQDLIRLREYLRTQAIEKVYLSYFGNVDPAEYGIRYTPLPSHFSLGKVKGFTPFAPAPGFYALSITNLSGQYFGENSSVLDWFNHQAPIANIGHSINVYRVLPDVSPPTWVGVCFAPDAPLNNEAFAQGVGCADLRFVYFDCRSSWVFAEEGGPAWLVVPATGETEKVAPPTGSWQVVFEQENYAGRRLFTIYRWEAQQALGAHLDALKTDPLVTPLLPVRVEDRLALLGYDVYDTVVMPGNEMRFTTYWQVLAHVDRPLSLMAHLLDQAGHPVAVGDALGVPVEGWSPGDVIVQTHQLTLDPAVPPGCYWLQTGAYWLSEMNRLSAFDAQGTRLPTDAIPLTTVEVAP